MPVRVREGMYTLINFPNWEVIENVYIGDGQSFNAEIQGPSSLMVYPDSSQFVGVDTNMIVLVVPVINMFLCSKRNGKYRPHY